MHADRVVSCCPPRYSQTRAALKRCLSRRQAESHQSLVRVLRQHAEAHIPDALQDLQQQRDWRPLRLQLIVARSALGMLKKADDHLHQMDDGKFRARLPLTMISAWIRRC